MIVFKDITYKNFLSTGDQPTTIELNKTITSLFTGKNGSGKSTFIDAIVYALFGKPYRKVRLGQLMNNVNEKGLECEVNFTIGSKSYRVNRGIKPSLFEIHVDGVMIPQPSTTAEYQTILEDEILRLNFKTFTQIIILGSSSFVPFMQLKLADRREIIENILDISIFSDMNAILKESIKDSKAELIETQHKLELTKERHKSNRDRMNESIANHQSRMEELESKIKSVKENIFNYEVYLDLRNNMAAEIELMIFGYDNVEEDIAEINKEKQRITEEIYVRSKDLERFQKDTKDASGYDESLLHNNTILEKRKEDIKNLTKILREKEEGFGNFESDLDETRDTIKSNMVLSIRSLERHNERLLFYKEHDSCPECKQGLEPVFRDDVIRTLETEIESREKDIKDYKQSLTTIEENINAKKVWKESIDKIKDEIRQAESQIESIEFNNKTLQESKDRLEVKTLNELLALQESIDTRKKMITDLESSYESFKKQFNELTQHKTDLIVTQKEIAVQEQTLKSSRESLEQLQEDLRVHKDKPASTITQEDIDSLASDIKNLDSLVGKLTNNLHYFGIVQRLLKDDGIKTKIIRKFLPIINATVNKYLDKFDFPINFVFDENFNETIQSNHRTDFSYYSFSEGEKDRIDLALLFTWREIALKKSRNAANLIIFDEIFDGSLDVEGIENFMSILGVDNEGYNSFIISHNDETINSRFDRHIEFVKDGHFSKMMEKS